MDNPNCLKCTHQKSCPKGRKIIRKAKKGILIDNSKCKDYRDIADIFDAITTNSYV